MDDERNHPTQSRKVENDELTRGPNTIGPAFNQDASGSLNFLYTVQTGTGVGSDSISVDPYIEGRTFLFPASQVFYINPFYTSDEPLVYVIGSLCFSNSSRKEIDGENKRSMASENPNIDHSDNYFDS